VIWLPASVWLVLPTCLTLEEGMDLPADLEEIPETSIHIAEMLHKFIGEKLLARAWTSLSWRSDVSHIHYLDFDCSLTFSFLVS
jgi:hypothetical protein